jgi:phosphotransferase system HPr (HPr) family protein
MQLKRKVKLKNPLGLHVRVAVKLVEEARKYPCRIFLTYKGEPVDAKDIISVLTLGATKGAIMTLSAEGDGATEALDSLADLFDKQFQV